jgi:hypothetical protein
MTLAINEKHFETGNYFVAVGLLFHSNNDFYFVFTLRFRQEDIVPSVSSPMPLLPTINYLR